jgi:acetyl-CoA carboxylase biotin carboxylase subunit
VTEAVTGCDLVTWQLRIARGERLTLDPEQALTPRGHAIECRIYAEDPDRGFLPSPGLVRGLDRPAGPFVRDDGGVAPGFTIPTEYDPLIAKLTVWGDTRTTAIERLRRALDEYQVAGVRTTLPFFRWLVREPAFHEADFSTTWLDDILASRTEPFVAPGPEQERDVAVAAALHAWFARGRAASPGAPPASGAWRRASRHESLR